MRPDTSARAGVVVMTVAVDGPPESSAISPEDLGASARSQELLAVLDDVHGALDRATKHCFPGSPCVISVLPSGKSSSSAMRAISPSSRFEHPLNRATLRSRSILTFRSMRIQLSEPVAACHGRASPADRDRPRLRVVGHRLRAWRRALRRCRPRSASARCGGARRGTRGSPSADPGGHRVGADRTPAIGRLTAHDPRHPLLPDDPLGPQVRAPGLDVAHAEFQVAVAEELLAATDDGGVVARCLGRPAHAPVVEAERLRAGQRRAARAPPSALPARPRDVSCGEPRVRAAGGARGSRAPSRQPAGPQSGWLSFGLPGIRVSWRSLPPSPSLTNS